MKVEETNQIKHVLADYEERKTKAVEHEKEALSKLLSVTDRHKKIDAVAKSVQNLENVLVALEEEKTMAVKMVIEKLVEDRFNAKSALIK